MKNCAVNRLMGLIEDPSNEVLKFGELRFKVLGYSTYNPYLIIARTADSQVSTVTQLDGEDAGHVWTIQDLNDKQITVEDQVALLSLSDKYGLKKLYNARGGIVLNLDDLQYCTGLEYLNTGREANYTASPNDKMSGSFKSLENLPLNTINLASRYITDDISLIKTMPLVTTLVLSLGSIYTVNTIAQKFPNVLSLNLASEISEVGGTINDLPNKANIQQVILGSHCRITGDISSLSSCVNLEDFRLMSSQTTISGRLDDLIETNVFKWSALKILTLNNTIHYTTAAADIVDAVIHANNLSASKDKSHTENGVTVQRYFAGGTWDAQ